MIRGPRAIPAVALGAFLAWQTAAALVDLAREEAAVPAGDRRRALTASEDERIEASVEWIGILRAVEANVPGEAIVAFCFRLDHATFPAFYHVVSLIYPRRAIPVNRELLPRDVEDLAERTRRLPRPAFIVDLESGFPLPAGRSRVVDGSGFTIWRIER